MPDFTPPANDASTVNCPALALVAPALPPIQDACGNNITPTLLSQPSAIACEGDMVWTYTYADCSGNSHVWTYTYTIDMPDFTPPANDASTVNCPALALVAPALPPIQDACGNNITPTLLSQPSAIACEGDMVWTYTYADCSGNSHVWTYTYTIDMPDFTPPANDASTVNCPALALAAPALPPIQDACGNNITPTLLSQPSAIACEGDMVWTYTYADCSGNSHVWTYTYTIDMPDFTPPANDASTVNCPALALVAPALPPIQDACGNNITPTLLSQPSAIACEGDMVWTYTYADCSGNSHVWTYTYTIDMPDFTPPANDASTVNCPALALVAPALPPIQDACGNNITPTLLSQPSAIACEGDMVWTYTYADCSGNSHVWTYTYTIDMPDFTPPANDASTVNCPALALVAPALPPIQDACGNNITPTLLSQPSSIACEGDMVWTYTYADCSGNSHVWTYTYTIDMPDFTPPANDGSTGNYAPIAL